MRTEDVAKLVANSRNRGFWVGLFPRLPNTKLSHARNICTDDTPDMDEEKAVEELHVTLFHLGRNVPKETVELTCAACHVLAESTLGEVRSSVEGVIRLPNHVGLLVSPRRILQIREHLRMSLKDRGVTPDDRFEGVPHMTLWKLKNRNNAAILPRVEPFPITFGGVTVVGGDFRHELKFEDSPI